MPQKPYFPRQGRSFYEIMTDARFDFRGGRNTSDLPDNLNATELVDCTNARGLLFGGLAKRTGTQRINATAVGAPSTIQGITQWDGPSGKQTVLIANGLLYYRAQGFGDFTSVDPGVSNRFPSAPNNAHFAPFRASTSGAPLVLYIACGGRVYSWDGTATLTRIDGTLNVPPASLLVAYHTRIFANSSQFPQFIFWSGVGLPTDFTPSTTTAGGNDMIDVLKGDSINALEVVLSSLIISTPNSTVRFTGFSSDDIRVAQDTEGISAELGATGDFALLRAEQVAFMFTTRGPYAVMEAGMLPVGPWVEPDFDNMIISQQKNVTIGYHRGRREVWFAYATGSDTGNKHVLVYNVRLQRWFGPFVYPFNITCFSLYIDSNNDEWLIAGCDDGFVRHMDIGALDDVLSGGTGGSTYNMTVEFAPYFFADGPGYAKTLRQVFLQGSLPVGHATTIKYLFDNQAGGFASHAITTAGSNPTLNYRAKLTGTGARLRLQVTDNSNTIPEVAGLVVEAYHRDRPKD